MWLRRTLDVETMSGATCVKQKQCQELLAWNRHEPASTNIRLVSRSATKQLSSGPIKYSKLYAWTMQDTWKAVELSPFLNPEEYDFVNHFFLRPISMRTPILNYSMKKIVKKTHRNAKIQLEHALNGWWICASLLFSEVSMSRSGCTTKNSSGTRHSDEFHPNMCSTH